MNVRSKVTKIATQGRVSSSTNEFVTEYVVQYSDDGQTWRSYVNTDGEVQVILSSNIPLFFLFLFFFLSFYF